MFFIDNINLLKNEKEYNYKKNIKNINMEESKLILIHGSHHGKWFYENFDNELNNKKINYEHFELLGHGERSNNKVYTIEEYSKDLFIFLNNKGNNIIIIAHSLGCLVTHYYINKYKIDNNKIKKMFFLAPSIQINIFKTLYSSIFSYKYLYKLFFNGVFGNSVEDIKNVFFTKNTDNKIVEKCFNRLEKINHTKLNIFKYLSELNTINDITIYTLVGSDDIITPDYCLKDLLKVYYIKDDSKFICFNNIGHNLLLDNNWKIISNYIIENINST